MPDPTGAPRQIALSPEVEGYIAALKLMNAGLSENVAQLNAELYGTRAQLAAAVEQAAKVAGELEAARGVIAEMETRAQS